MRQAGAPAEVISEWKAARSKASEVEVLWCNVLPVSIFTRCQPAYISNGAGVACIGVSMLEIRAAMSLMRVKAANWIEVTDDVLTISRSYVDASRR